MSGYVPPHIRRAAAAAGISVNAYKERMAVEAEARKPRNLGIVAVREPRRPRSSSERRRRSVRASGRGAAGRSVRQSGRRIRINMNTGAGVNEEHSRHAEPFETGDNLRSANYRISRPPISLTTPEAFAAVDQKRRRKTLKNVMDRRANLGEREGVAAINAALADLSARASLNAANALAIASIGERLYDMMDSNV